MCINSQDTLLFGHITLSLDLELLKWWTDISSDICTLTRINAILGLHIVRITCPTVNKTYDVIHVYKKGIGFSLYPTFGHSSSTNINSYDTRIETLRNINI